MDHDNSKYIKITTIENAIEAQLVSSILNEREIPHQVYSFHDTAFNGLFQTQKGWGKIMAPPSFKNSILEILQEVRNAPTP